MTGLKQDNPEFDLRGFNHLALVCKDMDETVEFYTNVLGMKLVKTLEYPNGGQHFFLDMGNGTDGIAFFWFPDAPDGVEGLSLRGGYNENMERTGGSSGTAIGTMNHLAFDVAPENMDDYLVKLRAKGVKVTEITNHSNTLHGGHKADYVPERDNGDVFVRSLYFKDPSGIVLEFAAWTTEFDESDVAAKGKTAADLKPVAERVLTTA